MTEYERPYEKMQMYSPESLTDAELLAIFIKSGNRKENSVELANRILTENSFSYLGIRFLTRISEKELCKFKGIGVVKATILRAIGEIVKRVEKPIVKKKKILNSVDAANYIMPELRYLPYEKICVILLDTKSYVMKRVFFESQSINSVIIPIKEIFKEPILCDCNRIILAHNHPSGNPEPSESDYIFTKEVEKFGKIFGIKLLDHLVIGDGTFRSIKHRKG